MDVWVHDKVGALSCRLQHAEEDSKTFGQLVQEVSQGITCWDKAPRQKFPAAALHGIMIHDRSPHRIAV